MARVTFRRDVRLQSQSKVLCHMFSLITVRRNAGRFSMLAEGSQLGSYRSAINSEALLSRGVYFIRTTESQDLDREGDISSD